MLARTIVTEHHVLLYFGAWPSRDGLYPEPCPLIFRAVEETTKFAPWADYPQDANKMAAEFVERLRAAGHAISEASFTHGGCETLAEPHEAAYWKQRYLDAAARNEPTGG